MLDNVLVGIEYEFEVVSDDAVNYVKNQLKISPIFTDLNFLERVAPEHPPEHGVEIITIPLPLPESLSVMCSIFKFIREVGSTSNFTGMHVNVSLTNKSFMDDTFNPAKLVTLADEEYIKRQFGLRPTVEQIGNVADLDLGKKNQTISFSHAFLGAHCRRSRVEFRYPGGKDYEKYPEKAHDEINRISRILVDSFSSCEM